MLKNVLKHIVEKFLESITGFIGVQGVKQTSQLMSRKMRLQLKRKLKTQDATLGELWIDGIFECYTLEDAERDIKIPGKTAIPKGTYKVEITWSPRFKRRLPLLKAVPGFDGIRIHPGNTAKDTDGCILVGRKLCQNMLLESRLAFEALFKKLEAAKEIEIEIS